ncbi:hypothetical protein DFH08DRAFT_840743 [Mycena albidolilacea]|uniref:DUF6533 domain-containing protein n=1 Tax=Mycena albidolilacea TaxID=1033008 RepID=A0AAD7F0V8_9AGAR|nr:hypothetical protein DFH08DRAFT_840743 [Mycena albidolilacea]
MSTDVRTQLEVNTNYFLNLVAFTLLYYEYFITLELEVSRFWGLRFNVPNVLFFANRYGMLLGTIPIVVQYFWTTEPTPHKHAICQTLHVYHEWFAVVTQTIIGVMLILRTYALYERNKRVLGLMVFVSLGVIGTSAWSIIAGPAAKLGDEVFQLDLYIGCSSGISFSQSIGLASAWGGMGLFDSTIFILTLYKALSRRTPGLDLVTVLLRDGSIYFGIILLVNVANILTYVVATPYTRGAPTTLANVISSIMISRLNFHLRDPSLSTMSGRFSHSGSATLTNGAMFSTYMDPSTCGGRETTHQRDLNPNGIELEDSLYP